MLAVGKKADVILQAHYHPSGKEEIDRGKIGIFFAKEPIEKQLQGLDEIFKAVGGQPRKVFRGWIYVVGAWKLAGKELKVEDRAVTLAYQNLTSCLVNYYPMDIELLFSRNPFVDRYSGQFAYIRPNLTADVELDGSGALTFDLPERFHSSNVLIEVLGGGVKRTETYFANTLALQLVGNYAQMRVREETSGRPLPKAYVKVFARMRDGSVRFYKDGYTDLRGRFDYASLSTKDTATATHYAVLLLSEEHGTVIHEVTPPAQ